MSNNSKQIHINFLQEVYVIILCFQNRIQLYEIIYSKFSKNIKNSKRYKVLNFKKKKTVLTQAASNLHTPLKKYFKTEFDIHSTSKVKVNCLMIQFTSIFFPSSFLNLSIITLWTSHFT